MDSYNSNIETVTSHDPIFNYSVRLSELIALSTGDIKKKWSTGSHSTFAKKNRFESETKIETIPRDTELTSISELGGGPMQ